jgi:rhamnogalacturonyl hydrolase YesR
MKTISNQNTESRLESSFFKLKDYIEKNNYKGHDPYDALTSPLFDLPILKSQKLVRFGTQQLVKRLPFNIRSLLLVPKGYNPVTIGLCIQGYGYLISAFPENKTDYTEKIKSLLTDLEKMMPNGFSGACWGYDFDWEARHAKIPAFQPTVVATGIITNGLYQAWKITELEVLKNLISDSAAFVINDLNRTYEGDSFCFSYSPFDEQRVFNASMKGVRLLAQAYSITGNEEYKNLAGQAAAYVMRHQRKNGSWGYSLAKTGGWVDNYHTGYILDCLDEYCKLCNDTTYKEHLDNGFAYYRDHFFESDGRPAFYSNNLYPADCTAASQSIFTLIRFGEIEIAEKVASWTIKNMQATNGSFYFRKFKMFTIKTSFMRWSNAWMFASTAQLLSTLSKKEDFK